ncbi:glycoside hydrolase family protein [Planoprotostelium fungivorum]|uniref:Glycoside hydrolase family protein n=1 Tax=Planoprotostelium fungivorum TaxID=1890364 RepID=A0A2P6NDB9_9EUKA|nr:glycoside hydrolase family protein [Planoprotostelium fungivorum]
MERPVTFVICFACVLQMVTGIVLPLNDTSIWSVSTYTPSDLFESQWNTTQVSYDNGNLTLTIDTIGCPNACGGYNWTAGEVHEDQINRQADTLQQATNEAFSFGYFEATFIPACANGGISSMFSYADVAYRAEIDIEFEGDAENCTAVSYTHYAQGQVYQWGRKSLSFNASSDFHAYGFLWTNDTIAWFVDRTLHFNATGVLTPNISMNMLLNNWVVRNPGSYYGPFPNRTVTAVYRSASYFPLSNLPTEIAAYVNAEGSANTSGSAASSTSSVTSSTSTSSITSSSIQTRTAPNEATGVATTGAASFVQLSLFVFGFASLF